MKDILKRGPSRPALHPWLTELPATWSTGPLKRFITRMDSGVSVNAFDIPAEEGQLGVLKTSCVYSGKFNPTQNKTVIEPERDLVACPVRVGTLIVSRMNTPDLVGAAGLVQEAAPDLYLPDRLWQITFHGLEPRFAHYWTQSRVYRAAVNAACAGTSASMQNLSQDDLRGFPIAAPGWQIQVQLADLLDRDTTRIDALIEKKTRFIDLLREKRQALITQAVTRGLDSTVPMKDSGVEWLATIPTHWEVTRLRFVIGWFEQGWSPECFAFPAGFGEWGIVKAGCLNGGVFNPTENKRLPDELDPRSEIEIRPGDVLMSRANGSVDLIGSVARATETEARLMLSDKIFRLNLRPDWDAEFFVLAMQSSAVREQIRLTISGAEGLANNLAQASIKDFQVAQPPIGEQAMLVKEVKLQVERLDRLCAKTEAVASLLRERRSALITAAVTGQIDVREPA